MKHAINDINIVKRTKIDLNSDNSGPLFDDFSDKIEL